MYSCSWKTEGAWKYTCDLGHGDIDSYKISVQFQSNRSIIKYD